MYVHAQTCTWMFTAALWIIAKNEATKKSFKKWMDKQMGTAIQWNITQWNEQSSHKAMEET